LEDISAPRCFEIERRLKAICDIPIFHDDQHGTAIVVLAAMINALKLSGRKMQDISVVIAGAGAAGIAITDLLIAVGLRDVVLTDSVGAVYSGREGLNSEKQRIAGVSNKLMKKGSLEDVIVGADVFIGVAQPGIVTPDMVRSMAKDPIVFPCSNPVPEIMPALAKEAGAAVVGTGRSDFPNQINNSLAFPGVLRGTLDQRASDINSEMKIAAAYAIAGLVPDAELSPEYIVPVTFDTRVAPAVAKAVAEAARKTGVAR
jgi:malate dehydrogenase (oxaloacetate-decarboxylating)